jgi:VWFA-related protein
MPTMLRLLLGAAVAVAALSPPAAHVRAQPAATPQESRTVYVTVVDNKGVPASGLTAADFAVKEDGKARPVLAAGPATTPLAIALMIDDSGLGLQSMREGAAAFITRLRGLAAIALITTGGRNIKVLDYTDSTAALIAALNGTYARNVTGAFLTDGIVDVANEFATREARRPVIVSMGVEGEDFSQANPTEVLSALQRTRTQLYMVRLGRPVIGQSNALADERGESLLDEQMRFNAVLGQAPSRTGGRLEQLASHTGIPRFMEAIAAELAGQYEVTFDVGDPAASDVKLEVSTTRRGLRVRAPTRTGTFR